MPFRSSRASTAVGWKRGCRIQTRTLSSRLSPLCVCRAEHWRCAVAYVTCLYAFVTSPPRLMPNGPRLVSVFTGPRDSRHPSRDFLAGERDGMVGLFLGLGSGYHGHRKRQKHGQADHDAELTHYPPPHRMPRKLEGWCSPTRSWVSSSPSCKSWAASKVRVFPPFCDPAHIFQTICLCGGQKVLQEIRESRETLDGDSGRSMPSGTLLADLQGR